MIDTKIYISPSKEKRTDFLNSLQADLNRIGHEFIFIHDDGDVEIRFTPFDFDSITNDEKRDLLRPAFEELKILKLNQESTKEFIVRMERTVIQDLFAKNTDIEIDKIKPEIRICKSKEDKNIFRYCRYLQSLPNSSGVGRRFSAIIYDIGQHSEKILGVIGLQGASYSSFARDEALGWSNIESRSEAKQIREIGLKRSMQLSVITAIPPYSYLFGSKLAALLALSNPIQEYFNERYNDPLLALFTTSAYGLHSAIYNRIQLKYLPNHDFNYQNYNNEMFRRVGETTLYSNVMISDETATYAKEMFTKLPNIRKGASLRTTLSKNRAILKALRVCGLNTKVLYLYPMGVYLGYLHENNLNILRKGTGSVNGAFLNLDVSHVREYWLSKIVNQKIKQHQINLLNNHDVKSIMLSRHIHGNS